MFKLVQKTLLPISWIHSHSFCEYGFFLEKVRGIRFPVTRSMVAGARTHALLKARFDETAKPIEEPLEEHVSKMAEGLVPEFSVREIGVKSLAHKLNGRIDEVRFSRTRALIIDNKPTRGRAWPSDINQLRAYCLAFRERFSWRFSMETAVQDSETLEFVHREVFGERQESEILSLIERIHGQLNGELEFAPAVDEARCRACRCSPACRRSKTRLAETHNNIY